MAINTDPDELRRLIREEFSNAMNTPMAALTATDFIGYNQVLGVDNIQPESTVTVTHSDGTAERITTGTYTVDPNTVWVYPPDDSGTFRVNPMTSPIMPFIPEPFVLPPPIASPSAAGIEELMRAAMRRNRNTIVPEEPPVSEMIKAVHFYPGGQCVILVNGPKINGEDTSNPLKQQLSPEQIKRLDRELKAAIIRAFDLVVDPKKLQEYKRTLIVD